LATTSVLASSALLGACGGGDDHPAAPGNIVQVAQGDARFSTLVEAVNAADPAVAAALTGAGPLTVLAPTNDAFAALLGELGLTKAQLLADQPLLTQVLKYHVSSSKVNKASLPLGRAISPLAGGVFKVDSIGSELVVTDGRNRKPKIVLTDLAASNGVIHALDKVLLPGDKTCVQTVQALAAASPAEFTTLLAAVLAADPSVATVLSGSAPVTVFAPTDAAFNALFAELGVTPAELLANTTLLTSVLQYHVVPSLALKAEIPVATPITTAQGGTLRISAGLAITDQRGRQSNLIATDTLASNGVIHVIDKVLLPAP
jgi:uncharacterized surface protein with fasciclin (FAS1) repeats